MGPVVRVIVFVSSASAAGKNGAPLGVRRFSVVSRIHYLNSSTRMQSVVHASDLLPPFLMLPQPHRSPVLAYHYRWRTRRQHSRSRFHPHALPLPLPPIATSSLAHDAPKNDEPTSRTTAAAPLSALSASAFAAAAGQLPLVPQVLQQLLQHEHENQRKLFPLDGGIGAAGETGDLAQLPPPTLLPASDLLLVARRALRADFDSAAAAAASAATASAFGSKQLSTSRFVAAAAAGAQGGSRVFWKELQRRILETRDLLPVEDLAKLMALSTIRFAPDVYPALSFFTPPFGDSQTAGGSHLKMLLCSSSSMSDAFRQKSRNQAWCWPVSVTHHQSQAHSEESEVERGDSFAAIATAAVTASVSPSASLLLPCRRPLPPSFLLACTRDFLEDLPLLSPAAAAAVIGCFALSNCCSSALAFALIERWRWHPAVAKEDEASALLASADTESAKIPTAASADQNNESLLQASAAAAPPSAQKEAVFTEKMHRSSSTSEEQKATDPVRDLSLFSVADFTLFLSSLVHILLQHRQVFQRQQRQLRHRLPLVGGDEEKKQRKQRQQDSRLDRKQQKLLVEISSSFQQPQQQHHGSDHASDETVSSRRTTPADEHAERGLLSSRFFEDCCCFVHAKASDFSLRSMAKTMASLAAALPPSKRQAHILEKAPNDPVNTITSTTAALMTTTAPEPAAAAAKLQTLLRPSARSVRLLLVAADCFSLQNVHLFDSSSDPVTEDISSVAETTKKAAQRGELLCHLALLLHAVLCCRQYVLAQSESASTAEISPATGSTEAPASCPQVFEGLAATAAILPRLPALLQQHHQQLPQLPLLFGPESLITIEQLQTSLASANGSSAIAGESASPARLPLQGPATELKAKEAQKPMLFPQITVLQRNQLFAAAGLAAAAVVMLPNVEHQRLQDNHVGHEMEQKEQEQQRLIGDGVKNMREVLCELLHARGATGLQTEHLLPCLQLLAKSDTAFSTNKKREAVSTSSVLDNLQESESRTSQNTAVEKKNKKKVFEKGKTTLSIAFLSRPPNSAYNGEPAVLAAAFRALGAEIVRRYAALSIFDKFRLKRLTASLQWQDPFLLHCLGHYTSAVSRYRPRPAVAESM